jgi:hypothetical protein
VSLADVCNRRILGTSHVIPHADGAGQEAAVA